MTYERSHAGALTAARVATAILTATILAGCETGSYDATRATTHASRAPISDSAASTRAPDPQPSAWFGGERYPAIPFQGFRQVAEQPLSTFSVDVDTASYAHVRRLLASRRMPPRDAVRIEEMLNTFDYDYPRPRDPAEPFAVTTRVLPNPWNPETRLLHVGLQGYALPRRERPPVKLVFLVDVSGSMRGPDRLGLAKRALKGLTRGLTPDDSIAIVSFANGSRTVLEPTGVARRGVIEDAIAGLSAGGSTGGAQGLEHAYSLAEWTAGRRYGSGNVEGKAREAVTRVILISDGDFNIGASDPAAMRRLIAGKRESGVYLSVLTVGDGNVNDHIAQALAQTGNGQAAHLDSLEEARKVLDDELTSNLITIAKDVKIQIEFNPALVGAYRLIGYETRALRDRDFRDERVDAGEVGSGHSVTALYEIVPAPLLARERRGLRYQFAARDGGPAWQESGEERAGEEQIGGELAGGSQAAGESEYAFVSLRYKLPGGGSARELGRPVLRAEEVTLLEEVPEDLRFAVAVAGFAQLLRGEIAPRDFDYDDVRDLAQSGRGSDPYGRRGAFLQLVRQADSLSSGDW